MTPATTQPFTPTARIPAITPACPAKQEQLRSALLARRKLESQAARYGHHGLFSQRDSLAEALDYAYRVIESSIPKEAQLFAFTALHVVLNTAALDRARADQAVQEGTSCAAS